MINYFPKNSPRDLNSWKILRVATKFLMNTDTATVTFFEVASIVPLVSLMIGACLVSLACGNVGEMVRFRSEVAKRYERQEAP